MRGDPDCGAATTVTVVATPGAREIVEDVPETPLIVVVVVPEAGLEMTRTDEVAKAAAAV